jgi:Fe-Mn family superoxide dismutase
MSGELNRRDLMASLGAGAVALSAAALSGSAAAAEPPAEPPAVYELPKLPYAADALAPVLSEKIVQIHHGRHHAAYVRGANAALAALAKARESGDMANVKALSRELAFHGSGHVLHSLYWQSLKPGPPAEPSGALREAIDRDFGSLDRLRAQFAAAAKAVEGSGWAALVFEPVAKRLLVLEIENHEKLTIWGVTPLMVCDVWEHAYYLQYENNRPKYVDAFWTIVDWPSTAQRYTACVR